MGGCLAELESEKKTNRRSIMLFLFAELDGENPKAGTSHDYL